MQISRRSILPIDSSAAEIMARPLPHQRASIPSFWATTTSISKMRPSEAGRVSVCGPTAAISFPVTFTTPASPVTITASSGCSLAPPAQRSCSSTRVICMAICPVLATTIGAIRIPIKPSRMDGTSSLPPIDGSFPQKSMQISESSSMRRQRRSATWPKWLRSRPPES